MHVGGVIEVNSCAMCQSLKGSDIFVYLPIVHAQLFHGVLGFLGFGKIGESIKEAMHKDIPWGATHEFSGVAFDLVQPVVLGFGPSFHLWTFHEQQEIGAFLDVVLRNGGSVIHEHELTELSEETACARAVAIEAIWGVPFQAEVSCRLHSGKDHQVITRSSWLSWLARESGRSGGFDREVLVFL